jgi:phage baseplate assembly protein W
MTVPLPGSLPPPTPPRIRFPYGTDSRGRTASCPEAQHVRQLIEQVLLTAPGERVMRPTFGGSLMQRVFEPGGPELLASTKYLVQATLSQELGGRITVDALELEARDAALVVTVTWTLQRTGQQSNAAVTIPGTAS